MIPVPGAPVVIAGTCPCGAVIQRGGGTGECAGCPLCASCCPKASARRTALQSKADKAVADLAASVAPASPSGGPAVNPHLRYAVIVAGIMTVIGVAAVGAALGSWVRQRSRR